MIVYSKQRIDETASLWARVPPGLKPAETVMGGLRRSDSGQLRRIF